jgi:hypothetical protein
MAKGARDRDGEEQLVAAIIIVAIARACGLDAALPSLRAEETIVVYESRARSV